VTRARAALALAGTAAVMLAAVPARAQVTPAAPAVLARACMGRAGQPIDRADIAEALLIEANLSPADIARGSTIPLSSYDAALVSAVRAILAEPGPSARRTALADAVRTLEQRLNVAPGSSVTVEPGGEAIRLFGPAEPAWRIICKEAENDRRPEDDEEPEPRFAVRETPEELWLTDEDRLAAKAFSLGFERTRTVLDDGTRKTETSLTVDGTVGLRLDRTPGDLDVFLFATYNLERDRVRPAPSLAPGASQSDGDTDALALGIDGGYSCADLCWVGLPVDFNLQASAIFDFANDASRVRLRAIATPRLEVPLGICNLNSFGDGPLRGRCELAFEIQAAHVTRRGTTALGNYDTFLAAGGRIGVEFFLPTRPGAAASTGFLASLRYRYLPVIHGAPDDIEQFEAKLGHRFWTGADVGIDVGFTYTRGTNELSFEEENILTFGLGLIY
jgi:hypothetical protein